MNVIADLCVVPIGVGVSVSKYVAERYDSRQKRVRLCERILKDAMSPTASRLIVQRFGVPSISRDWKY